MSHPDPPKKQRRKYHKITADQAGEIKRLYFQHLSIREVSRRMGLTLSNVHRFVKREKLEEEREQLDKEACALIQEEMLEVKTNEPRLVIGLMQKLYQRVVEHLNTDGLSPKDLQFLSRSLEIAYRTRRDVLDRYDMSTSEGLKWSEFEYEEESR